MPFSNNATPKLFTKAGIEWLNPDQHGVYGIYREGDGLLRLNRIWVYVGRGDIRSRLLDHLRDNREILAERPTHYVAELANPFAAPARERELILELNPLANQRVG